MKDSSMNASRSSDKGDFVNPYPTPDPQGTVPSTEEEIIVQAHPVPRQNVAPGPKVSLSGSRGHQERHELPPEVVPKPSNYYDDLDEYSLDLQKETDETGKDMEDPREEPAKPGHSSTSTSSGHQEPRWNKKKLLIISGVALVLVIVGVVVGVVVGGKKPDEEEPTNPYVLSQECTEEIYSLESRAGILEALSEVVSYRESVECPENEDCYFDYAAYEDMYESACNQEGGRYLSLDFSFGCEAIPYRYYHSNSPRCIGLSCDPGTYVLNTLYTIESNLEEEVEGDCDAKLEFNGNVGDEPENVASTGELTQQCIDEFGDVYNHTSMADANAARDELGDVQIDSCAAGTSTVCPIDYASVGSLFETACLGVGGKFIVFDYAIDCTGARIEFSNFPLCIGASCDTGAFKEAFITIREQNLQEDEDLKSCVVEG